MVRSDDARKIAESLEQAQSQGIIQITYDFAENDTHMCAVGAIYKVITGMTPTRWGASSYGKIQIAQEFQQGTGIDLLQSYDGSDLYTLITKHNDFDQWTFAEIAETFRCIEGG